MVYLQQIFNAELQYACCRRAVFVIQDSSCDICLVTGLQSCFFSCNYLINKVMFVYMEISTQFYSIHENDSNRYQTEAGI